MTGSGINTVCIEGEIKHITDLDAMTLSNEWSKLKNENAALYRYNHQASQGWRGHALRLMGVHLLDKERVRLEGINAQKKSAYSD
ncbi:hypothetical protein AGJ34_21620 [Cronobacter dublinensis subsp. dublinensis]|nr:hypothetical protein [Cronobacter dublinensis subsp. dublinensis]EGT5671221.1 hypothetical protein [Cronobacter dublinensis subsp. dublinensis]EGT5675570.1 hypothetical protein [Cronobacter dublinensis subsp. dublinensis]EGT5688086.1 hypothetical protein [Cronobacter dublinensis subsp. dublinensis]EGT5692151.1 hypothetical protein [Cronobacter dublinensis subsp. dublinensis]